MQASTYGSVNGKLGFDVQNQKRVLGFGELRNRTRTGRRNLFIAERRTCCGGLSLRSAAQVTGAKIAGLTMGSDGISVATLKARSVQAQASDGDVENLIPSKPQGKSSGTVLPYVGVACLGAILFGYHLGVVNGALEYLSIDLGIAENAVLQGWVVSTLLAGATVGSLTGGSLADKFGRTKTFQLNAIPLAIGAFLWSVHLDGDVENLIPSKPQGKSSGTVLPYVGVACLGAILFGYHLGVVNGALEYLSIDLGIAENAVLQGWVVSTLLAGATVGSLTGGSLADKFGRTKTFQLNAIPLAIGAFLCATAQSVQTMIVGRLLAGIGIGITSAIVPLYISEISPTEIRGTLGSINQLFICIGILVAMVAGLPSAANPLWWRTMFGIAVVPSVLLALGMVVSPESPRWLFQQGKFSEAEKAIKTLFGKERVTEVMDDLRSATQGSVEPEAGWFDLFSSRYWKVVRVGVSLFFLQQMAGINAAVYYSTSVFRSAGITSDVAASALVGIANVLGTAIASSLMDKQGRKSLLLGSFGGMAASMLLLSLSFTWKALDPYSAPLSVTGTFLYVLSFALGAGPVPALLLPEIFASRIRAKAVSLSLGMHWISNFAIGLYFLSFVTKFGIGRVYFGFAGVCLLAVLYIAGNIVETKGRSLEEIERALSVVT